VSGEPETAGAGGAAPPRHDGTKTSLRAAAREAVAALGGAERLARSARAQERLMATPEFRAAHTVLLYHSDADEVGTREIIMTCLEEGRRVALPRTDPRHRRIAVRLVLDVSRDTETSRFGFREPRLSSAEVPVAELDLIVVPGRAFGEGGERLGRGGGYYDRFLARPDLRAVVAGLAFDCQVFPSLPVEGHDRRVELLITESRVLRPGSAVGEGRRSR
jgi:5-formyltetrahydrofolate cyclo-ligase